MEKILLDKDVLLKLYNDGISVLQMSKMLDVSRQTIIRNLTDMGINTRTATEANLLRFKHMSKEDKKSLTAKCNSMLKGYIYKEEELIKRAKHKSGKGHRGYFERELVAILLDYGYTVEVQKACDKYNIDIVVNNKYALEIGLGMSHSLENKKRYQTLINNDYIVIGITFQKFIQAILSIHMLLNNLQYLFKHDDNCNIYIYYEQIKSYQQGLRLVYKSDILKGYLEPLQGSIQYMPIRDAKDALGNVVNKLQM